MVLVPAGEFAMGQEGVATPVHCIRINRDFWLGQCAVTNAQYQRYCQEVGADFPQDSNQGDRHPVVGVNWAEANAYCQHYGLALPTTAQWEYAARGPEGRTYPWGNRWDEDKCCNAAHRGPRGRTFPVGSFPQGASWCGALDMAGNVWQWCRDWFSPDYYAHSPDTDPSGPKSGELRAARGGSWFGSVDYCRAAHRYVFEPSARYHILGFRCLLTP
jgi:iron(II)-dependent oxidoreductase